MKIAFRVDASSRIGSGHVMRCLTLAGALRKRGEICQFVCRHVPAYMQALIQAQGHEVTLLPSCEAWEAEDGTAHASWLGVSQARDAWDTGQALAKQRIDWLIIDHYALDVRWESVLRESIGKLMVIDDLADRVHDCDVLLDQNFYPGMDARYQGKVPANCVQLLGPKYALLREEFLSWRQRAQIRSGNIDRVLVFFGGIDATNCTRVALHALQGLGLGELSVDVVVGAQHPDRQRIEAQCAALPGFACHVQTAQMAMLMAHADLSLGAAGSSTWERCCLGLPVLALSLAENQVEIARTIDRLNVGKYLGPDLQINVAAWQTALSDVFAAPESIRAWSRQGFSIVEGNGADLICDTLDL